MLSFSFHINLQYTLPFSDATVAGGSAIMQKSRNASIGPRVAVVILAYKFKSPFCS